MNNTNQPTLFFSNKIFTSKQGKSFYTFANVDYDAEHTTATLYSKTKTGTYKYWIGIIVSLSGKFYTCTAYGQSKVYSNDPAECWKSINKVTLTPPKEITSKNIGKSNETTLLEQSISEIQSAFLRKVDKGYFLVGSEIKEKVLPMLALEFNKRGKDIDWSSEVYTQPKLDGVRCLLTNNGTITRGSKEFIPEIFKRFEDIATNLGDTVLDGELILFKNNQMQPLQDTVKAVKKYDPNYTDHVMYIVYDIVNPALSFTERLAILKTFEKYNSEKFFVLNTTLVNSVEDIIENHNKNVQKDFEGTMIRSNKLLKGDSGYLMNKRSATLLKFKDFLEAEFEIEDVTEGTGKYKNIPIFTMKNPYGPSFNCVPIGTEEYRKDLWNNSSNLIGQKWTIRFQEYTKDKVPQFPRAICKREF